MKEAQSAVLEKFEVREKHTIFAFWKFPWISFTVQGTIVRIFPSSLLLQLENSH